MRLLSNLMALWLSLILSSPADPLRLSTTVSPKPHYVGQSIEIQVEVSPVDGPFEVEASRVPGFDLYPIPAEGSIRRYVALAGRSGSFDLPTFRARAGERSARSKPVRLAIAPVPVEGRTASFLGGVGPFEVQAEVDRSDIQPGDPLEFRLKLVGSAAIGSLRSPDLSEWRLPGSLPTLISTDLEVATRSVRTFRYRVRFLKAGTFVLPPVAVSAFDPTTRRYVTNTTSSITIRVAGLPRFDPDQLEYGQARPTADQSWSKLLLILGALMIGSILGLRFARKRWRTKLRPASAHSIALELADGLRDQTDDQVEAARVVAETLTTFLQRVGQRTPGVLTPPEALDEFGRLTGRLELGKEAEMLLARCDRTRFGAKEDSGIPIQGEARRFFEKVARVFESLEGRGESGPGEAVETGSLIR